MQFSVDTRGRDQCQAFAGGEFAVSRQPGAGTQATFLDICGELVNELLVAVSRHGERRAGQ